jgi:hypothetical protein
MSASSPTPEVSLRRSERRDGPLASVEQRPRHAGFTSAPGRLGTSADGSARELMQMCLTAGTRCRRRFARSAANLEGFPLALNHSVMAGLVPAIHVFLAAAQTWMPGTRPGMTEHVGQVEREPL